MASWSAALVAALVGFGGTIVLVVQAMENMGASVEEIGSAVTALCLGIALGGAALSFRLRMPVILAWSTPGAALLAAAPGVDWPLALGAFLAAGLLMIVLGAIPWLSRLAERIPGSIASAMLAGVLLPFCLELFRLTAVDPLLVTTLLAIFVVARRRLPLHALLLVLVGGVALTLVRGTLAPLPAGETLGRLLPVLPRFDVRTLISVGLPLFLVTLASQNLPGLLVLRSAGYGPPPRSLLVGTGLATVAGAPFGAHAVNLAAITAAICTNAEAHPDKDRRWIVGMLYAGFYLVLALFSPGLVRLFLALPHAVVAALTGLALVPAFTGAAGAMLSGHEDREPAILTFLVTGSGMTMLGLGSAFWGLMIGFAALAVTGVLRKA
ncbi:benzoate/H(+) symporter BenE family transporter [Sphingosinicella sp. BN140058]|uniref:benzoate/H(+) symporter BenE family transporter n=1 Tax=Sphingosinicella sp. BN140058 TaxID=1892855 RepID=UPI001013B7CC|nr:benzoate/H(+) symporter BenE family transporter [Sphingosinicella sp. BN140058]QAY76334.1 benzoate transporter BenE [Sphingosinicella sp. BN140058]